MSVKLGSGAVALPVVGAWLAVVGLLVVANSSRAQSFTADQALATALAESPELRATLLDTLAAREASRGAAAARVPVFRATVDASFRESFGGTAAGVVRNDNRILGGSLGVSWVSDLGTTVSLDVSSSAQWRTINRDPSTTTSFAIGPNYVGQALVNARQPLLRGGGRGVVLAAEREAEALEQSATHQRDVLASEVVRDVLVAYWELWYAERALAVDRDAAELAERQQREAQQRVELGTFAPTEALRFASELARLREVRRGSEATRRARALELARLLGGADPARLVPDPAPPNAPPMLGLAELTSRASMASPELLAREADREAARQRLVAATNTARARLDLVGTAGIVGLWAEDDLPGLQLPGRRPGVVAIGGLELELPIGSTTADAQREGARLALEAADERLMAARQTLEATIAAIYEEVASARERVPLASESAAVAERLAEAERGRLELGTATPADLLLVQQAARESELRRLRTLVDAVTSSHRLAHAAGVLLDRFSIDLPQRRSAPTAGRSSEPR